jgi:hypothetical protein
LGTLTLVVPPDEMTRLTELPEATLVPAAGDSLMTDPDGTVELAWFVTVPTLSPAEVIAVVAADCVWPTTFGTLTLVVPPVTVTTSVVAFVPSPEVLLFPLSESPHP